ncbi:MAG TPA: cation:proton antiporter [Candidatus Binatia bacterium]|nr:cation:proton antiporter [Candidatus Binatia bacterium]
MFALLVFAVTLLVAVFLSEIARRSILSTAVLFLLAGFIAGMGEWISVTSSDPVVSEFSRLALFSVLFTDGMRVGVRDLVSAWHLPGRALLLGFPINLLLTAMLAHWIAGLPWIESFLLGAVLSPTDPVFAAAIVGREEIPNRTRHLLNVESGVNDGLALPLVLVFLAAASGKSPNGFLLIGEVVLGIALGIIVPWVILRLERIRIFSVATRYESFQAFAIALLLLALASLTHANEFLAAFFGGVTITSSYPEVRERFHEFGERLTELLKLAALLVFGALMPPEFFAEIRWPGYLLGVLILFAVRPVALSIALAGSSLQWREWITVAWFGPRGFASVVFGLIILQSGIARGDEIFHLIALVVVLSIFAHSSTDVLLARRLHAQETKEATI